MTVGLLMGIWNEADRIVECLDFHLPYVKTHPDKPIKVLHFPKMGFSEATLQDGLEAMTADWVLYVDADEKFPEETLKDLHSTLENTSYDGFWFERDNYFDVRIYNDAQPGMEPQVMRIQHPARDAQSRLSRRSLSEFYRQIHVRVRILREDGTENWGRFNTAIQHIKSIEEQWQANRDYQPAVKMVYAIEKLRHGEFIEPNKVDRLYAVEDIPFDIKRAFWIYADEGDLRGMHANREVNELLYCIKGRVTVNLERRKSVAAKDIDQSSFELDDPIKGLLIPKNSWIEMSDFINGTVLLCLASTEYSPNDYIRDHEKWLEEVKR